jgi:predicted Zn-dependent protease
MRVLAVLIFAGTLLAQDPGRGVNFYSIEKERALGAQLAAEYQRSTSAVNSPELLATIEALGLRMVPSGSQFKYTFALVQDKGLQLNEPVSLPGGFIFVPSGLIESARNVDEFAGMLAHAIAHVEARHGTRQATKGQIVNQATIPLIFMGGWTGYSMRQNASLTVPLGFLKSVRAFQFDADALGGKLMSAAGYSPARLADYIDREQAADPQNPNRLSAQPPRAERVAALRALPSPAAAPVTLPDLERMQELLRQALPVTAKEPPRLAR